MPGKRGAVTSAIIIRPRAGLGLTAHVPPEALINTSAKPERNRVRVASAKPPPVAARKKNRGRR